MEERYEAGDKSHSEIVLTQSSATTQKAIFLHSNKGENKREV
jgi:hypothetical protein